CGGTERRVSSPPGTFSTLMTSAPMSASIKVQAGPAMMWVMSMTLSPLSAVISSTLFGSTTGEAGLGLVQESLVADLEILGAEAGEALVVLLRRQRGRVQQTPGELLVPTSHQRRPLRDPARGG